MGLPLSERGHHYCYIATSFIELPDLLGCVEGLLNLLRHLHLSVGTEEALVHKIPYRIIPYPYQSLAAFTVSFLIFK